MVGTGKPLSAFIPLPFSICVIMNSRENKKKTEERKKTEKVKLRDKYVNTRWKLLLLLLLLLHVGLEHRQISGTRINGTRAGGREEKLRHYAPVMLRQHFSLSFLCVLFSAMFCLYMCGCLFHLGASFVATAATATVAASTCLFRGTSFSAHFLLFWPLSARCTTLN